jgi:hypothetical protein
MEQGGGNMQKSNISIEEKRKINGNNEGVDESEFEIESE